MDGKFTGLHYQKRARPVADCSAVDAKRGAEDNVNVSRKHFGALPFATELTLHIAKTCNTGKDCHN